MKILILLFLTTLTLSIQAQTLTFKLDGKVVYSVLKATLSKGTLKIKTTSLKESQTQLFNAWRGYSKEYVGYNFTDILDAIYGPKWKSSKKIVFTALDGYSPFTNTKKMIDAIKTKKNLGILTYKETGISGFTSFKRGEKSVDPGPFYIVWSNFTEGDKATYGDILKWPYQLKEIDIVLK